MINETKVDIFHKILENQLKSNKIPHAFLLVGYNLDKELDFLKKSLLCNNDLFFCDRCDVCEKINHNSYFDILEYDGNKEIIKKENILKIQEAFKKTALEGDKQIYIIKNIDNSRIEAMNALLKLLEEPQSGIYAIFTTSNENKILPTILSRCQVFRLNSNPKDEFMNKLLEKDISREDVNFISSFISSVNEIEEFDYDKFLKIKIQAINFIRDLYEKPNNLIINTQISFSIKYPSAEELNLFLKLILFYLQRMFHVKHEHDKVVDEILKDINFDYDKLIVKCKILLEAIENLKYNANPALLLDWVMCKLKEG